MKRMELRMRKKLQIAFVGLEGEAVFTAAFALLANELAPRLARKGHGVTVYRQTPPQPGEGRVATAGSVELRIPGSATTLSESMILNLFCAARAALSSCDVLLTVHSGAGWVQFLSKWFGHKAILQVAGMDWLHPQWNGLERSCLRVAARRGCRSADHVVSDSLTAKAFYSQRFGVSSSVIGYGAEPFFSRDPALLVRNGLVHRGFYLCMACLLTAERRQLLAQAFTQLESPRLLVLLDSSGPGSSQMREARFLAEQLGGRVRIIRTEADAPLWRELFVHSFAYLHVETPGRPHPVILTALAGGACILAEDSPFSREVLAEGAYGLLWPSSSKALLAAIRRMERSPELAEQFRQVAQRRIAERYSWEQVADAYEALLLRVCGD
ncbi:MAG TPA: glycosyltransferase [Chthoniobacterales bacterium]